MDTLFFNNLIASFFIYNVLYMKRLIVFIEGQSKEIELDESFIITHENLYLLIKKATVFFEV